MGCEDCPAGQIYKSGNSIRRLDGTISYFYTSDGLPFIVRRCVKKTDSDWREKEIAGPDAECIFPDRVPSPV